LKSKNLKIDTNNQTTVVKKTKKSKSTSDPDLPPATSSSTTTTTVATSTNRNSINHTNGIDAVVNALQVAATQLDSSVPLRNALNALFVRELFFFQMMESVNL
jgi:hypothetical protein